MRSTPVAAIAPIFARLTPPGASSRTAGADRSRSRTASRSLVRVHVVEEDDVGPAVENVDELLQRVDFGLDRDLGRIDLSTCSTAAAIVGRWGPADQSRGGCP